MVWLTLQHHVHEELDAATKFVAGHNVTRETIPQI